jgi:hypothetical protein
MGTAYTMALPPAVLPAMGSVVAAVGASLLYTVLLVVVAITVGTLVQNALARPATTIRLVPRSGTGAPVRQPA